ncbi:hypothetical protein TRICI_003122 [Trichomonascus ciferrii]|uniref:ATP-dependent RNA helicase n=1 Tax=Trichomonascus ciferrii TaxID=44093 RepID=A0A642V4M0_9ASCO|nr:hypothetical protein TRICI_003122 [Trichomonascus ciferrii]
MFFNRRLNGVRLFSSNAAAYAKKIKRNRTLSPNVKSDKEKKLQFNPRNRSDKEFMIGPPNTGEFGRLKLVEKRDRIVHKNTIEKIKSFSSLRIEPSVREAIENELLGHLPTKMPTPVQKLAIKAIRATKRTPDVLHTYLLAAETGSGKTLSYLAPLMSNLKDEETNNPEEWEKMYKAPLVRSVVFVPTLELVSQVNDVVRKLTKSVKLTSFASGQGISNKSASAKLTRRTDILITTPDRFLNMFKNPAVKGHLSHCKFAVVDEADTLMDESFCESTHESIQLMTNLKDLVFCSATIPRSFDRLMKKTYPNAARIVTPGLHKIPRHIDFRVVEVFKPPFLNSKQLALQQALYAIHHDNTEEGLVKRVVVFVNKAEDIEEIVNHLNEKGYPSVGAYGKVPRQERMQIIQDFVSPAKSLEEYQNSKTKVKVLVTTDLLARGVDMQGIRNIILYDLPYSSVDMLHRAGRTGRLNRRGRVLLFVTKKESQGWVKGIERTVRNGMALA